MGYTVEKKSQKYFIGLELRTNNQECSSAMPAHKEKFFRENIPAKIPQAQYAVFTTQGEFLQGLIAAWQAVWKSNLPRSYTSDFEVYRANFDPQKNPEVKVYIAID